MAIAPAQLTGMGLPIKGEPSAQQLHEMGLPIGPKPAAPSEPPSEQQLHEMGLPIKGEPSAQQLEGMGLPIKGEPSAQQLEGMGLPTGQKPAPEAPWYERAGQDLEHLGKSAWYGGTHPGEVAHTVVSDTGAVLRHPEEAVKGLLYGAQASARWLHAHEPKEIQKFTNPADRALSWMTVNPEETPTQAFSTAETLGRFIDPGALAAATLTGGAAEPFAGALSETLPEAATALRLTAGGAGFGAASNPEHPMEGAATGAAGGLLFGATPHIFGAAGDAAGGAPDAIYQLGQHLQDYAAGKPGPTPQEALEGAVAKEPNLAQRVAGVVGHEIERHVSPPAIRRAAGELVNRIKDIHNRTVGMFHVKGMHLFALLHQYKKMRLTPEQDGQIYEALDEYPYGRALDILPPELRRGAELAAEAHHLRTGEDITPETRVRLGRYVAGKKGVMFKIQFERGGPSAGIGQLSSKAPGSSHMRQYVRMVPLDHPEDARLIYRESAGKGRLRIKIPTRGESTYAPVGLIHERTGASMRDEINHRFTAPIGRQRGTVNRMIGMAVKGARDPQQIEQMIVDRANLERARTRHLQVLKRLAVAKRPSTRGKLEAKLRTMPKETPGELAKRDRQIGAELAKRGISQKQQVHIQRETVKLQNMMDAHQHALSLTKDVGDDEPVYISKTKNGGVSRMFRFENAPVREIEHHTGIQYGHQPIASIMMRYLEESGQRLQLEMLDNIRQLVEPPGTEDEDPNAPKLVYRVGSGDVIPHGFKAPRAYPEIEMPARAANLIDSFTNAISKDRIPVLAQLNDATRMVMFHVPYIGGLWHRLNIVSTVLTQRGMDLLFHPKSFAHHWLKAARDVREMNESYQHFVAKGVAFQRSGLINRDLYEGLLKSMGEHVHRTPGFGTRMASALGVPVEGIVNGISRASHAADVATWTTNDTAMLSSIYYHMDHGMNEDEAIAQANKENLAYRMPMEQAWARWLQNQDLSWFASYHYDLFRIMGNTLHGMLGRDVSMADRQRAYGQAVAMYLAVGVVQPVANLMLNALIPPQPGKERYVQPFGVSELPATMVQVLLGNEKWEAMLRRVWTPAPATASAISPVVSGLGNQSLGQYLLNIAGSPIGLEFYKGQSPEDILTNIFLGYGGLLQRKAPPSGLAELRHQMYELHAPERSISKNIRDSLK